MSLKALRASNNAKKIHIEHTQKILSLLGSDFNKIKVTPKTPFVISYYNKFSNQSHVLKVPQQLRHTMNSAHMAILLANRYNRGI